LSSNNQEQCSNGSTVVESITQNSDAAVRLYRVTAIVGEMSKIPWKKISICTLNVASCHRNPICKI